MPRKNLKCNKCGILNSERQKLPNPSWEARDERYPKSFRIGEKVWCPECFHEEELRRTFEAMDRYAERHGEDALARACGIKTEEKI